MDIIFVCFIIANLYFFNFFNILRMLKLVITNNYVKLIVYMNVKNIV
ncbi:hypothetical protein Leryth_023955 [Lithospermum erythrorhizon]|nr:hypothetical protein Leryth_023955 [Lithospermum erythrorhizon]